ncbi:hypothetical protein KDX16_32960, partial [Burkholderia vietnamiensis]|uniref:hypothetical protein n=1 Tax=Burkholderia vietnamiensis TaxID=60552 RepID=UPI001B9346CE
MLTVSAWSTSVLAALPSYRKPTGFARSDSKADAPGEVYFSAAPMQKPPPVRAGVSGLGSLTITYFHTGIRTIIGVESFHGPVRD